jgi:predicted ferric reductase
MKAPHVLGIAALAGLALGLSFGSHWIGYVFPDAGGHGPWYASRAAGFAAYLALWASLVVGILMSSTWLDGIVNRGQLLAAHQTLAVIGVAFALAHAAVLIPDQWTAFSPVDLFVPFASQFERVQTGVGTIALWLFAIVTFSFWVRTLLGPAMWRMIHYASVVAYLAALWHGARLGTDTAQWWAAALYIGTFSILLGAFVTRLTYARPRREPRARAAARA